MNTTILRTKQRQATKSSSSAALDFAPAILALQERPPSPLPRTMLYCLLSLVVCLVVWVSVGRLDIIAVAEGKLVPETYLKIVQPADAGIIRDILVHEGDTVAAGQVLLRLDPELSEADSAILATEIAQRDLQLRRIDAELSGVDIETLPTDSPMLFAPVQAQYRAHRKAHHDALAEERAAREKAKEDLAAAEQTRLKLVAVLPAYQQEEAAWNKLGERALAGQIQVLEKRRARIEAEQDLKSQTRTVAGLKASIAQSEQRLAQITSNYEQQLHNERIEAQAARAKLQQELTKQRHKQSLLELKAPQRGIIKDLATHTLGTVVNPGTVLMTLVPVDEKLRAEVTIKNEDAGFVHEGQVAKLKIASYPFQKYGLVEGRVIHISADADEPQTAQAKSDDKATFAALSYKALVELSTQELRREGTHYALTAGMRVAAEIHQGDRTILEYLLTPVQGVFHEALRER